MNASKAIRRAGMTLLVTSSLLGMGAFEPAHAGAGTTPRHGIFREAGPQVPGNGAGPDDASASKKGSFDLTKKGSFDLTRGESANGEQR